MKASWAKPSRTCGGTARTGLIRSWSAFWSKACDFSNEPTMPSTRWPGILMAVKLFGGSCTRYSHWKTPLWII